MEQTTKEERAARTRRLIQIGALAEKYFSLQGAEPEEAERVFKAFVAKVVAKGL